MHKYNVFLNLKTKEICQFEKLTNSFYRVVMGFVPSAKSDKDINELSVALLDESFLTILNLENRNPTTYQVVPSSFFFEFLENNEWVLISKNLN